MTCHLLFLGSISPADHSNIIHVCDGFRMIVLANRPGFPFLGNDFYGAVGMVLLFKFSLTVFFQVTVSVVIQLTILILNQKW